MTWYKFIPILLLVSTAVSAQQSCGIFAKRDDFMQEKVTYRFDDCRAKVQGNKDIVARHKGEKMKFKFDFIYGYTDGINTYRAYGVQSVWKDHGYYKVIYDKDVVVYSRISRDFRSNLQIYYYFSLDKDSPILPLKRKFYSYAPQLKGALQLHVAQLKEHIGLNVSEGDEYVVIADATSELEEKKKPDISARLQTTTRRPKIF